MKHARKPERGPDRKPPAPRRGPPRAARPGRSFKAELAREYGVTEVPKSLKLRTEKTLATLPDVMPSKPRPLRQVFRGMATVAAALAVTSAVLLGLNTTSPQITESLPGLGSVFAAMNERTQPSPLPMPTPAPTPEPKFQQVTAENRGGFPGTLTVEEAWTDGKGLWLELALSPEGEEFYMICKEAGLDGGGNTCLLPSAIRHTDQGDEYAEYTCSVNISSDTDTHSVQGDAFPAFMLGEDGKFRASWYLDLGGLDAGSELKVAISLPDLNAQSAGYAEGYNDSGAYTWNPGFKAAFALPVTVNKNRAFSLQASDGPVTLRSISYTPSKVELDVSQPYLGLIEDIMPDNGALSGWPLGFYARLSCQGPDGERFIYGVAENSPESLSGGEPELSSQVDLRYSFTAISELMDPRELSGPLVLTIYELPPNYVDGPSFGRVNAEFTIDLNTGRASPSENYLEEGLEKGDASKTTLERIEDASYDGLILMPGKNYGSDINTGNDPLSSFVISAPSEKNGMELMANCYLGESVYRSFSFTLGGNFEEDGDYCYTGYHYVAGKEFLDTGVTIAYPQWMAEEMGYVFFDRIELADAKTGKVVIPDLQEALIEASYKLLDERYFETSGTNEADGSLNGMASQPEL